MKIRLLAAFAIVATAAVSLFASGANASAAGARSVAIDLESLVTSVGDPYPTAVDAKFIRKRGLLGLPGQLQRIQVTTYNERVSAVIQPANSCVESGSGMGPACDTVVPILEGATISSAHTSTAVLTNPKVTMINVAELGLPGNLVQAVSGNITGSLVGQFTIGSGANIMRGTAYLDISGTATYICLEADLAPSPLLLTCELGLGKLLPYGLHVVDTGTFEITQATGIYADAGISHGGGSITVIVDTPGVAGQPVGSMIIPSLELIGG